MIHRKKDQVRIWLVSNGPFNLTGLESYFEIKSLRNDGAGSDSDFGSLWMYVICQIMTRERLQSTSWNLGSEKYTGERLRLTGKIWRFRSFHGIMND